MRSRQSAAHQDAVARRLEQLRAELAGVSAVDEIDTPPGPAVSEADGDGAEAAEDAGQEWWHGHTRVSDPERRADRLRGIWGIEAEEHLGSSSVELSGEPSGGVGGPGQIPIPGRHAARRSARGELIPETMRGRYALAPAAVAVVAVLVAVGVALAAWQVVRHQPEPLAAPSLIHPTGDTEITPSPASTGTVHPSAGAEAAKATGASVTVDIAGKVRRPGIAVLPEGSRVIDALDAAGGARRGVDLTSLNLARVLVDGEQILVGTATAAPAGSAGSTEAGPAPGQLVNLNTATQDQLESLPQVGPVTAQAIIAWRSEHGGFSSIDELLEVDGIGPATLAQVSPWVTV